MMEPFYRERLRCLFPERHNGAQWGKVFMVAGTLRVQSNPISFFNRSDGGNSNSPPSVLNKASRRDATGIAGGKGFRRKSATPG